MSITIKRPEKIVELCTDLSLQAEHDKAVAALEEANRTATNDRRLGGKDPRVAAAKAVQAVEAKMSEHILLFTLRALPRAEWTRRSAKHTPRKGEEMDSLMGVNVSTFYDDVMPDIVVGVERKADGAKVEWSRDDWGPLADEMTNAQWEQFAGAAFELNKGRVLPDFNKAASRTIQGSESK